jgi:hypothetical protein
VTSTLADVLASSPIAKSLTSTFQTAARSQKVDQGNFRSRLALLLEPPLTSRFFFDDQVSIFTVGIFTFSLMVTYRFFESGFPTCSQQASHYSQL